MKIGRGGYDVIGMKRRFLKFQNNMKCSKMQ